MDGLPLYRKNDTHDRCEHQGRRKDRLHSRKILARSEAPDPDLPLCSLDAALAVRQSVLMPTRSLSVPRWLVAVLLACVPVVACGGPGGGHAPIECKVTEETSDYRKQPPGTLIQSDTFEGCVLGEVIVCPDDAGSDYDGIRCGEIQTGSVRRD